MWCEKRGQFGHFFDTFLENHIYTHSSIAEVGTSLFCPINHSGKRGVGGVKSEMKINTGSQEATSSSSIGLLLLLCHKIEKKAFIVLYRLLHLLDTL